jgi:hypothetical protein
MLAAYRHHKTEIDELAAQLRLEDAAVHTSPSPVSPNRSITAGQVNGQIPMAAPPAVVPLPGATNKMVSSLPTSAPASKSSVHPPSSNELDVPSEASSPMLETPTSASLPTASKPGSRDGAPYSDAEVRLIEQVIREALKKQPDIKLAQLGVLIHGKVSHWFPFCL